MTDVDLKKYLFLFLHFFAKHLNSQEETQAKKVPNLGYYWFVDVCMSWPSE